MSTTLPPPVTLPPASAEAVPNPRRRRVWLWVTGSILVVLLSAAAALVVAARVWWPQPTLRTDPAALAQLRIAGHGEHAGAFSVTDAAGHSYGVANRHGRVVPTRLIAPGTRLTIRVIVHRASWIGWLVGRAVTETLTVTAPVTAPVGHWLTVRRGHDVIVVYNHPVTKVIVRHRLVVLAVPTTRVDTGILATGSHRAGSIPISAAARSWESFPAPTRISWFPAGVRSAAIITPVPGAVLNPASRITIAFARTVRSILGRSRPALPAGVSGAWRLLDPHRLLFVPSGAGFAPGSRVELRFASPFAIIIGARTMVTRSITWTVPPVNRARFQQLLALEGYLPVIFVPAHHAASPPSLIGQEQAAIAPPAGRYLPRFTLPPTLAAVWQNQQATVIRAAVMVVERTHGLSVDGVAGSAVFAALIQDAARGRGLTEGYNYVDVSRNLPERLTLWHNGHLVTTALVNTGVAGAETAPGTYPVFEHIPVGTMSGHNLDGSKYTDPGIQSISYFNGGDALHGFLRGGYGYPQSLGCVEMTNADAGAVWPYTPVGTLVTVNA